MYEEDGIIDFEHPLCFHVQSNTDPWRWYVVELLYVGQPGHGEGECNCKYGKIASYRAARGIPHTSCDHVQRVRALVAERVARGDYDQWLRTL